jgi:lysophospholipase L1-like esterase
MIQKLIISAISIFAFLLLIDQIHLNNIADKVYPLLSKVFPLEKIMIESGKYQKLLHKYQESYNYINQVDYLFFGDSHIQYFNVKSYFSDSNINNYGIAGDTTEGVLDRLPNSQSKKKIKDGVLFMVGYNDLKYKDVQTIISNYRKMLVTASKQLDIPFSKIILQSLFPVSRERVYVNDSIIRINQAAKVLCAELGCIFLDVYANFTDPRGGLRSLYSKDGVHLNQAGYDAWASLLKQSLKL